MADDAYTAIERDGVWGVYAGWPAPAPPGLPAWVEALSLMQWHTVPNTAYSTVVPNPLPPAPNNQSSRLYAWNGVAINRATSRIYLQGGGHGDNCGNDVTAVDLAQEAPSIQALCPPTYGSSNIYNLPAAFFADFRPSPTHTYYSWVHSHKVNVAFVMTTRGMNSAGLPFPPVDWPYNNEQEYHAAFLDSTNDWERINVHQYDRYPIQAGGDWTAQTVMVHPVTGDIYFSRPGHFTYWKFDPAAAAGSQWTQLSTGQGNSQGYAGAAIDPTRNRILLAGNFAADRAPQVRSLSTFAPQSVTFGGLGANALLCISPSVVYDDAEDCFWVVMLGPSTTTRLLRVEAGSLVVSEPTTTGSLPLAPDNGIHGKAQYVPALRGVAFVNRYDEGVKFIRTSL